MSEDELREKLILMLAPLIVKRAMDQAEKRIMDSYLEATKEGATEEDKARYQATNFLNVYTGQATISSHLLKLFVELIVAEFPTKPPYWKKESEIPPT